MIRKGVVGYYARFKCKDCGKIWQEVCYGTDIRITGAVCSECKKNKQAVATRPLSELAKRFLYD